MDRIRASGNVRFPPIADISRSLHSPAVEIASRSISRAVEIACLDGNSMAGIVDRFSRARQVVFMEGPLSADVKSVIATKLPNLRYYRSEGTPHNPADEGFADDAQSVVISFPLSGETDKWT
jgi:hypothetical protein